MREMSLSMPELPVALNTGVSVPRDDRFAHLPLVVLLDDGPPVDVTLSHPQRFTIDQLERRISRLGYPVWRPLRPLWQAEDLTVYCPDQLTAWVQLGLRAAYGIPQLEPGGAVVLGFGQGGVIASLVARRTPDLVAAVGLVGTPARALDIVLTSPALRDSVTRIRLLDTFGEIWANALPDTAIVLNGSAQCWRAWLQATKEMPLTISAMPQPVLAVQGTADTLLPMLDVERLRRVLESRENSRAELALGVQHDLRDAVPDPQQDPDLVSPRAVEPILSWLRAVAPLVDRR